MDNNTYIKWKRWRADYEKKKHKRVHFVEHHKNLKEEPEHGYLKREKGGMFSNLVVVLNLIVTF